MKVIWFIFVGLCCLILSYGLIREGIAELALDHEFGVHSSRTTAVVTRLWITNAGRRRAKECWATLSYQVGDEGLRETTVRVSPPNYDQMKVDEQIRVKVLTSEPGNVRIDLPDEENWHWLTDAGHVMLGGLIILGAVFVGWVALPQSRQSWEDAAVKADLAGRDRFS